MLRGQPAAVRSRCGARKPNTTSRCWRPPSMPAMRSSNFDGAETLTDPMPPAVAVVASWIGRSRGLVILSTTSSFVRSSDPHPVDSGRSFVSVSRRDGASDDVATISASSSPTSTSESWRHTRSLDVTSAWSSTVRRRCQRRGQSARHRGPPRGRSTKKRGTNSPSVTRFDRVALARHSDDRKIHVGS